MFLRVSDNEAQHAGIPAAQHGLLITLAAEDPEATQTVGDLARECHLRHHSVVGLLDRMEERGLVVRERMERDRRRVRVRLAPAGEQLLERLSAVHGAELRAAAPALVRALSEILTYSRESMSGGTDSRP
ncbi:MAG TPA: helix-turn-helix domain-containing protein [Bryobacteraceae bacterium]|nr:helix-turn-helix domain-containing protein [Bryobacteraceae bacterium]